MTSEYTMMFPFLCNLNAFESVSRKLNSIRLVSQLRWDFEVERREKNFDGSYILNAMKRCSKFHRSSAVTHNSFSDR